MLHSRRHLDMGDYFQNRTNKWDDIHDEHKASPPQNTLLLFCDLILKYEKYKMTDEMEDNAYSPSGSERTNDSFSSESELNFNDNSSYSSEENKNSGDSENDSWDLITCFCMKPFKGRPMIECNRCRTWLHMSCVKIRPSNVPDIFICQFCQETKSRKRRSERIRSEDRRLLSP